MKNRVHSMGQSVITQVSLVPDEMSLATAFTRHFPDWCDACSLPWQQCSFYLAIGHTDFAVYLRAFSDSLDTKEFEV